MTDTDDAPEYAGLAEHEVEHLEELIDKDEDDLSPEERTSKARYSLSRKFEFPWLFTFEHTLRNGRRVDAIAIDSRPSRGMPIVGFEIKATREDWLREKRNRDKADLAVQFCDEWYVVAAKRGIVEEDELPDGWGLFELKPAGALWEIVESDLDGIQDREPDRRFFGQLLKKAIEHEWRHSDLREARKRGYEAAREKLSEQQIDHDAERLRDKAEAFDALKEVGLTVSRFQSDDRVKRHEAAMALVKAIEADEFGSLEGNLDSFERSVERNLERIDEMVDDMRATLDGMRDGLDATIEAGEERMEGED